MKINEKSMKISSRPSSLEDRVFLDLDDGPLGNSRTSDLGPEVRPRIPSTKARSQREREREGLRISLQRSGVKFRRRIDGFQEAERERER